MQLLLLLLLLVPTHPQRLSRMQGTPSMGGDSSEEDDPLGEEDLPSEEDLPGEEDTPGMKTEAEEDSPKIEDLPTAAPRATHRNNKGKRPQPSKPRLQEVRASFHQTPAQAGIVRGRGACSRQWPFPTPGFR